MVGISKTELYDDINAGLVAVIPMFDSPCGQTISDNELEEYARYKGIELWNTRDIPRSMVINPEPTTKKKPSAYSLARFLRVFKGYDGSLYIRRVPPADLPALRFVCDNIFRYNQIQMRHRPYASQKHIYLCWKTPKQKKEHLLLQKKLNSIYASEIVRVCELDGSNGI